jgi:hypothetical protein
MTFQYSQSLNGAVGVAAPSQALGDTQAGQWKAECLAVAAMTFEVINGRAVQVYTTAGTPLPGTAEL